MAKAKSLSDYSLKLEKKSYDLTKSVLLRLVQGLVLFKRRKGEVIAGASTFFTLLSFAPALLLFINMVGLIIADNAGARDYVMRVVLESFPKVDSWIYNGIESVVNSQLHDSGLDFLKVAFLIFASMGISTSIVFGINILSKVDPDGGLLEDDLRSFFTGIGITIYMVLLVCVGHKGPVQEILQSFSWGRGFVILFDNSFISSILSLLFFSLFYKYCPSIKVATKDAFRGGATFVLCFLIGRSTYWIYVKYFKDDLVADYGQFTNFMIALIWIYFLMSCFYYGASVAYAGKEKIIPPNIKAKFKKKKKR
ncbi:hypothetical protein BIY24_09630 [Halobacteriovorax marinus]|uniref:Ribonuclease n=1 Tax=Halobacteriovorax marinus (strain ATCC BAA-682 / DSM 15412 / SJ) TaxID=862908 RepID=E1X336_HALMS|nr:YihY/virulence factor BrkB family protein [Halobacteriovorax marinus]ATH08200.1 hypothetical protein BIY24_09630 [Halobacteriovorax marinus]CBW26866.1 putative ribonuclease [Halobacteriovorax marinus SJ]